MGGAGGREGVWALCMANLLRVSRDRDILNLVRAKLKIKLRWNRCRFSEALVEAFGRWFSNAEVLPSIILSRKVEC